MSYIKNNIHKAFHAANESGAFFPNTFFLYLDFPGYDVFLGGNRASLRTLWHEYMHFLQTTTTTYGINVFIREYELALLTIKCVNDLKQISSDIMFPLTAWRNLSANKRIRDIIDYYSRYREMIEQDLATLQGACFYDTKINRIIYKKKPVINQGGCPFLFYEEDPSWPLHIPLGSRTIMEGVAHLLEYYYLSFLGHMGNNVEAKILADEWVNKKDQNPLYYITIDISAQHFKNDIGGGGAKLMAISDLSLCPPIEYIPFSYDDYELRHPGHRFLKAMEVAKDMPSINPLDFHDYYKEIISDICVKLGWQTPWELVTKSLTEFIEKKFLRANDNPYCDLIGPALVLLNGLTLRKNHPSYCANPIPSMPEAERIKKKKDGPVIIDMEMVYHAHTPPFVKTKDGSPFMSYNAKKAMAGQIAMEEDELIEEVIQSFEKYFFIQSLTENIWTGIQNHNSRVRCLQCFNSKADNCEGNFGDSDPSRNCRCTCMFNDLFGLSPNQVRWASPEDSKFE